MAARCGPASPLLPGLSPLGNSTPDPAGCGSPGGDVLGHCGPGQGPSGPMGWGLAPAAFWGGWLGGRVPCACWRVSVGSGWDGWLG
eukprot:998144-Alexandrium_andersonii.AAC.1